MSLPEREDMKKIRFDKVNGHTFFLTPVIGFTKNYRWEKCKIEYRLCFAWFKLHVGILVYTKKSNLEGNWYARRL